MKLLVFLVLLCIMSPLVSYDLPEEHSHTIPELRKGDLFLDSPEEVRPKVALVLSGGAANGFAHIGVIRVLEEAGIPIDLVIGVSMGGLVGSLYAAGYSPKDMEVIIDMTDWRAILTSPSGVSPYLRAPVLQTRHNILSLHFDANRIGRSLGVLPDQRIVSHLSRYVYKVSHIRDFDQLHIPLRVMGTDLFSGEAVAFNHVPLHAAMRATMAIPGLFSPHLIEGTYYLDGGVTNNLPISLARSMGADIVVSIDTMLVLKHSIDEFSSAMSVVTQAAQLAIANIMLNEESFSNLHFKINFPEFSSMEFWKYRDFIAEGERIARSRWDDISALAEEISLRRDLDYRDPDRIGPYRELPSPKLHGVEIDPSLDVPDFPIELFSQLIGEGVSNSRIENAANRLVAARTYESIGYSMRTDEDNNTYLSLYPVPYTRGKHYGGATFILDGSYTYKSADPWRLRPGFSVDLVFSDLLGSGSLLALNFHLIDSLQTDISFTIPLTTSIYVRPFISIGEDGLVVPGEDDYTAAYLDIGQELGFQLKPNSRFGISIHLANSWIIEPSGNVPSPEIELLVSPRLDVQSFEPKRFPYSGIKWKSHLEIPIVPADPWYQRFVLEFNHYVPFYFNGTFGYNVTMGSYKGKNSNGETNTFPWSVFDIGGWDAIPGYAPGTLVFPDAATAGICYYHRFSAISGIMGMDIYAAAQLRGGFGWQDILAQPEGSQFYAGVSAGIGIDGVLGEMVIGAGVSMKGNAVFYLLLN